MPQNVILHTNLSILNAKICLTYGPQEENEKVLIGMSIIRKGGGGLSLRVDVINPFTLCAKLLRSVPKFYALKKLLKSWAQSVRACHRA